MAKIWPVYEGREPTIGGPWAALPAQDAIDLFELRPTDYVSGLERTPRFGDVSRNLTFFGYKNIVVEIGRTEGNRIGWRPGFYRSRIKPEDGFGKLIQQALVAELGANNVVRVEHEPTIDSQGEEALKITIVIAPRAIKKLAKDASLNALVRLQERLSEMRETRTPIIEYATEAELARNGAH